MSQSTNINLPITLQDFLKVPTDKVEISVSRFITNFLTKTVYECVLLIDDEDANLSLKCTVQKRYTEFQGFYDSLTYRYQNLKFPPFPSKFQIVKQKESRKKFFDSLLKTVIKLAEAHPEIKKELLKLLFEFVISPGVEIKKLDPSRVRERRESFNDNLSSFLNQFNSGSFNEKDTKSSFDETSLKPEKKNSMIINDTTMIANMFQKEDISNKGNVYLI